MGRRSIEKERIRDPRKRKAWIDRIAPVFLEKGFTQYNMDELSKELGCSKATLYKHFESHKEIVSILLSEKIMNLQLFQQILHEDRESYEDRYKRAVTYVSTELADVSNVFLSQLKTVYPDIWSLVDQFKQMAIGVLKEFYTKGIQAEVFHPLNPEMMALSDELFFDVLTDPQFLQSKGMTLKGAFDDYFEMRFNGILRSSET